MYALGDDRVHHPRNALGVVNRCPPNPDDGFHHTVWVAGVAFARLPGGTVANIVTSTSRPGRKDPAHVVEESTDQRVPRAPAAGGGTDAAYAESAIRSCTDVWLTMGFMTSDHGP